MNILRKLTAEQAREAYRQKRLERARQNPDPTLPTPESEGLLEPIPGDNRALWPKASWGQALKIKVPTSVPVLPTETLTFLLNDTELGTRVLTNPAGDPTELEYEVSADLINEERLYTFTYRHMNITGNEDYSFPLLVNVDHTPPNNNVAGAKPVLPQELIDNGLWLDYLNDNPTVEVTIPRSSDITAGDSILVYWGRPVAGREDPDPTVPVVTHTVTEAEASPTPGDLIVVGIPSANIKNLQAGAVSVLYRYVDRTGNQGQPSAWQALFVSLDPQPENLEVPEVPLADDDGLIDRADARLGVKVVIPEPGYDNQIPAQDLIEVIWEGRQVPGVRVSTFPMEIPINWPTLSAGGATTDRAFKVRYNVVRGPLHRPSPEIDVNVDFTVAGVDPDPDPDPAGPDPINDKLPLVVIKSRENSPVDNVLGEADKGEEATAQIPSNPVTAGQTLRLYWGSLTPHVAEVTITNEQPTDPIEFTIPWAKIQEGGCNEKLPVYYTTWNGVNEQESDRTEVDVRIVELSLEDVVFPDRYPDNPGPVPIINCCSLPWDGIKVEVQGDSVNFAIGDTLEVSWQAYSDMTGVTEIPDTDYAFPPVDIDDQDKVDKGFVLTVPYADCVEPIVTHGSGRVTCTLTKASGQSGSHVTLVIVSRVLGAGLCSPQFPGICH